MSQIHYEDEEFEKRPRHGRRDNRQEGDTIKWSKMKISIFLGKSYPKTYLE